MKLNEIFPNGAEFMDWLANNCYSCAKLPDDAAKFNPNCELEPIISYSNLNVEIDENLTKIIIKNGKLCKCKNFTEIIGAEVEKQKYSQEKLLLEIQSTVKHRGGILGQYRHLLIEMVKRYFTHGDMVEMLSKINVKISRQSISSYLLKVPITRDELNAKTRIAIKTIARQGKE